MIQDQLVIVKGAGDLGSGCAARLHRAGFRLLMTELPQPLVIRRAVSFASAVYQEQITVENITAQLASNDDKIRAAWEKDQLPISVDPEANAVQRWQPEIVIDTIMAKRNTGTRITDAPVVIAIGPGFVAGQDCHAVVETSRGHNLGRVYYSGACEPDTTTPGRLGGQDEKRVLRAPTEGIFRAQRHIGDQVNAGQIIAYVNQTPIHTEIDGVVRGLLADGLHVPAGMKVGDVDPRGVAEHCFTISDKAWAIGGGVLEAILRLTALRPKTKDQ